MLKEIGKKDIIECVIVIRTSFQTVADEFGFTVQNAPRFTAFATTEERLEAQLVEENRVLRKWYESFGFIHIGTQKFDFFPFTCGYMEKNL